MTAPDRLARRTVLAGIGALLSGCDRLAAAPRAQKLLGAAESLTRRVQTALTGSRSLAPEYSEAEISTRFRANGSTEPDDAAYQALAQENFAGWRLELGGLVETPLSLTLSELRALPARTQITRHDCVEGWSCIAKWRGVPLAILLDLARPQPEANYVMVFCADTLAASLDGSDARYYESLDLADARHPQTILAYDMNDSPLPIRHGAPLRLRNERQLGYKMAKYVMRLELVAGFGSIRGGRGGYWEDRGYEWYAGI